MLVEERPLASGVLLKKMRPGEWPWPETTIKGSESSEEALPQGEVVRHKVQTRGIRRFYLPIKPPVLRCPEVNPVGKPSAGRPHAVFDERGWETGQ